MTSIPAGTKFHGVAASVPTSDKKSATLNALSNSYSIEDIVRSTTAGNTTEIQYNLNGAMSADPNLTKGPDHFFAISEIGDKFFVQGSGDWSNTGILSEVVGHYYSNADVNGGMLTGNLVPLGLTGEGHAILISDDATGENSLIYMRPDLASMSNDGSTSNGILFITQGQASLGLQDPTGLVFQNSVNVTPSGIQIATLSGSYTLPLTDGKKGQVLSTDGAGNLSWITP